MDTMPHPPKERVDMSSVYRELMGQLDATKGPTPHWPIVLQHVLAAEFRRQQPSLTPYVGEVAIRRDDSSWEHLGKIEDRDVRRLFKTCEDETHSVFTISGEPFFLLGWQWPNQGNEKGRRADLVGMNSLGGLVVFEAKGAANSDTPFMAMLEGLDYLVHLTLAPNFAQIVAAVQQWKQAAPPETPFAPPPFDRVEPSIEAPHEVVVLAPKEYFAMHTRSGEEKTPGRGHGWKELARRAFDTAGPLRLKFAVTDFTTPTATWATWD